MNKEEKQLLFKDLCARLPYGVKLSVNDETCILEEFDFADLSCGVKHSDGHLSGRDIGDVKPYLRPMSSMTDDEKTVRNAYIALFKDGVDFVEECVALLEDFYNKHHLDYGGLIERGLALEATKEMYQ